MKIIVTMLKALLTLFNSGGDIIEKEDCHAHVNKLRRESLDDEWG